jgi:hypothetical protein
MAFVSSGVPVDIDARISVTALEVDADELPFRRCDPAATMAIGTVAR